MLLKQREEVEVKITNLNKRRCHCFAELCMEAKKTKNCRDTLRASVISVE